jgi:Ca2+-binding EF-hand superfamily protein
MVRSLGFRMTRVEIVGMVESLWEDRQQEFQRKGMQMVNDVSVEAASAQEQRRVDVSMAIAILAQRGYTQRSVEEEIAMYFRIYDHGNKGYIDLQDLQRVQQEVKQAEVDLQREMQSDVCILSGGDGIATMFGDDTLSTMIEEFDRNGDKVIDFDEFRRILESIIS